MSSRLRDLTESTEAGITRITVPYRVQAVQQIYIRVQRLCVQYYESAAEASRGSMQIVSIV